jgi:hypothetical protein
VREDTAIQNLYQEEAFVEYLPNFLRSMLPGVKIKEVEVIKPNPPAAAPTKGGSGIPLANPKEVKKMQTEPWEESRGIAKLMGLDFQRFNDLDYMIQVALPCVETMQWSMNYLLPLGIVLFLHTTLNTSFSPWPMIGAHPVLWISTLSYLLGNLLFGWGHRTGYVYLKRDVGDTWNGRKILDVKEYSVSSTEEVRNIAEVELRMQDKLWLGVKAAILHLPFLGTVGVIWWILSLLPWSLWGLVPAAIFLGYQLRKPSVYLAAFFHRLHNQIQSRLEYGGIALTKPPQSPAAAPQDSAKSVTNEEKWLGAVLLRIRAVATRWQNAGVLLSAEKFIQPFEEASKVVISTQLNSPFRPIGERRVKALIALGEMLTFLETGNRLPVRGWNDPRGNKNIREYLPKFESSVRNVDASLWIRQEAAAPILKIRLKKKTRGIEVWSARFQIGADWLENEPTEIPLAQLLHVDIYGPGEERWIHRAPLSGAFSDSQNREEVLAAYLKFLNHLKERLEVPRAAAPKKIKKNGFGLIETVLTVFMTAGLASLIPGVWAHIPPGLNSVPAVVISSTVWILLTAAIIGGATALLLHYSWKPAAPPTYADRMKLKVAGVIRRLQAMKWKGYQTAFEDVHHQNEGDRLARAPVNHLVLGPGGLWIHLHIDHPSRRGGEALSKYFGNGLLFRIVQLSESRVVLADPWMEDTIVSGQAFVSLEELKVAGRIHQRSIDTLITLGEDTVLREASNLRVYLERGGPIKHVMFSIHYPDGGRGICGMFGVHVGGSMTLEPSHRNFLGGVDTRMDEFGPNLTYKDGILASSLPDEVRKTWGRDQPAAAPKKVKKNGFNLIETVLTVFITAGLASLIPGVWEHIPPDLDTLPAAAMSSNVWILLTAAMISGATALLLYYRRKPAVPPPPAEDASAAAPEFDSNGLALNLEAKNIALQHYQAALNETVYKIQRIGRVPWLPRLKISHVTGSFNRAGEKRPRLGLYPEAVPYPKAAAGGRYPKNYPSDLDLVFSCIDSYTQRQREQIFRKEGQIIASIYRRYRVVVDLFDHVYVFIDEMHPIENYLGDRLIQSEISPTAPLPNPSQGGGTIAADAAQAAPGDKENPPGVSLGIVQDIRNYIEFPARRNEDNTKYYLQAVKDLLRWLQRSDDPRYQEFVDAFKMVTKNREYRASLVEFLNGGTVPIEKQAGELIRRLDEPAATPTGVFAEMTPELLEFILASMRAEGSRDNSLPVFTDANLEVFDLRQTPQQPGEPGRRDEGVLIATQGQWGPIIRALAGKLVLLNLGRRPERAIVSISHEVCTVMGVRAVAKTGEVVLGYAHVWPGNEDPRQGEGEAFSQFVRVLNYLASKEFSQVKISLAINANEFQGMPNEDILKAEVEKRHFLWVPMKLNQWPKGADALNTEKMLGVHILPPDSVPPDDTFEHEFLFTDWNTEPAAAPKDVPGSRDYHMPPVAAQGIRSYAEHEEKIDQRWLEPAFNSKQQWIQAQRLHSDEPSIKMARKFLGAMGAPGMVRAFDALSSGSDLDNDRGTESDPAIHRIMIKDTLPPLGLPPLGHASDRGLYVFSVVHHPLNPEEEAARIVHEFMAYMAQPHYVGVAFEMAFRTWIAHSQRLEGFNTTSLAYTERMDEEGETDVPSFPKALNDGKSAIERMMSYGSRSPTLLQQMSFDEVRRQMEHVLLQSLRGRVLPLEEYIKAIKRGIELPVGGTTFEVAKLVFAALGLGPVLSHHQILGLLEHVYSNLEYPERAWNPTPTLSRLFRRDYASQPGVPAPSPAPAPRRDFISWWRKWLRRSWLWSRMTSFLRKQPANPSYRGRPVRGADLIISVDEFIRKFLMRLMTNRQATTGARELEREVKAALVHGRWPMETKTQIQESDIFLIDELKGVFACVSRHGVAELILATSLCDHLTQEERIFFIGHEIGESLLVEKIVALRTRYAAGDRATAQEGLHAIADLADMVGVLAVRLLTNKTVLGNIVNDEKYAPFLAYADDSEIDLHRSNLDRARFIRDLERFSDSQLLDILHRALAAEPYHLHEIAAAPDTSSPRRLSVRVPRQSGINRLVWARTLGEMLSLLCGKITGLQRQLFVDHEAKAPEQLRIGIRLLFQETQEILDPLNVPQWSAWLVPQKSKIIILLPGDEHQTPKLVAEAA